MPAQFRSRVTVLDHGRETKAVIEMNHELSYGGYRFFQSSYRQGPGRDETILSVSRDPGEDIVFFGYYGLDGGDAGRVDDTHRLAPSYRARGRRRRLCAARGRRHPPGWCSGVGAGHAARCLPPTRWRRSAGCPSSTTVG